MSTKKLNIKCGDRFGLFSIVEEAENFGKRRFLCKCDCGTEKIVFLTSLREGKTKSCGCIKAGIISKLKKTHGKTNTNIHRKWRGMKDRCSNKNSQYYRHYGGRGITVCDDWKNSFEAFYRDMGDATSSKHSLDRIDNNGNYCKENCRWATGIEQVNNRRIGRKVTYQGKTMSVSEWARELGIPPDTLYPRLNKYAPEIAFTMSRHSKKQFYNKQLGMI